MSWVDLGLIPVEQGGSAWAHLPKKTFITQRLSVGLLRFVEVLVVETRKACKGREECFFSQLWIDVRDGTASSVPSFVWSCWIGRNLEVATIHEKNPLV